MDFDPIFDDLDLNEPNNDIVIGGEWMPPNFFEAVATMNFSEPPPPAPDLQQTEQPEQYDTLPYKRGEQQDVSYRSETPREHFFSPFPQSPSDRSPLFKSADNTLFGECPVFVAKQDTISSLTAAVKIYPDEIIDYVGLGLCWQLSWNYLGSEEKCFLIPGDRTFSGDRKCLYYTAECGDGNNNNDGSIFLPIYVKNIVFGAHCGDFKCSVVTQDYHAQPGELSLYMEVRIRSRASGKTSLNRYFSRHIHIVEISEPVLAWPLSPTKTPEAFLITGAVRDEPFKKLKRHIAHDSISIYTTDGTVHCVRSGVLSIAFTGISNIVRVLDHIHLEHTFGNPSWDVHNPNCLRFNVFSGDQIFCNIATKDWANFSPEARQYAYSNFISNNDTKGIDLILSFRIKGLPDIIKRTVNFRFCIGCAACRIDPIMLGKFWTRFASKHLSTIIAANGSTTRFTAPLHGQPVSPVSPVPTHPPPVPTHPPPVPTHPSPVPTHPLPSEIMKSPKGLVNLGNTCFVNVILQSLFNSRYFVNAVSTVNTAQASELFRCLMRTMNEYHSKELTYKPDNFIATIRRNYPTTFGNGSQHDVHDFFALLYGSFPLNVANIFSWQQTSTIVCSLCKYESKKVDTCNVLSLPLPCNNLVDCVKAYCAEESLTKSDMWTCRQCNKPVVATKRLTFGPTFPNILMIHLKRFENASKKILGKVNFSGKFSLTPTGPFYQLQTIIYHLGAGMRSGHYICAIRYTHKSNPQHKWVLLNDNATFGFRLSYPVENAYILLYSRLHWDFSNRQKFWQQLCNRLTKSLANGLKYFVMLNYYMRLGIFCPLPNEIVLKILHNTVA